MDNKPILIKPSSEYHLEFLEMVADYQQAGENYWHHQMAQQDFAAYLRQVRDDAKGLNLPGDYAPMTTFWLVKDRVIY